MPSSLVAGNRRRRKRPERESIKLDCKTILVVTPCGRSYREAIFALEKAISPGWWLNCMVYGKQQDDQRMSEIVENACCKTGRHFEWQTEYVKWIERKNASILHVDGLRQHIRASPTAPKNDDIRYGTCFAEVASVIFLECWRWYTVWAMAVHGTACFCVYVILPLEKTYVNCGKCQVNRMITFTLLLLLLVPFLLLYHFFLPLKRKTTIIIYLPFNPQPQKSRMCIRYMCAYTLLHGNIEHFYAIHKYCGIKMAPNDSDIFASPFHTHTHTFSADDELFVPQVVYTNRTEISHGTHTHSAK